MTSDGYSSAMQFKMIYANEIKGAVVWGGEYLARGGRSQRAWDYFRKRGNALAD